MFSCKALRVCCWQTRGTPNRTDCGLPSPGVSQGREGPAGWGHTAEGRPASYGSLSTRCPARPQELDCAHLQRTLLGPLSPDPFARRQDQNPKQQGEHKARARLSQCSHVPAEPPVTPWGAPCSPQTAEGAEHRGRCRGSEGFGAKRAESPSLQQEASI